MAKLLSSLPVGTLVKDEKSTYYGKPIVYKIAEHGHSGDPSGSTTLVTANIIAIKAFDAKEPNNSNSNRQSYGNNRWSYANLKQWLNSDVAAGKWYAAQHSADQSPDSTTYVSYNPYTSEAGFLNGFSDEMKAALLTVTKRTAKNTVTDGGSYEDVSSKMFLLSNTEVGLSNENSIAEGSIYALFNTASERKCKPTAEAVSNSTYTNSSLSTSSNWYWWLRTPDASCAYNVRNVDTDGSLGNTTAYHGDNGVRPACCISSSILVSDAADTDGAYEIQWNAAPVISTNETNLGDRNTPFDVMFSIKDPDGDSATASVKLDGTEVVSLDPVDQSKTYTYSVTGTALNALSIGNHSIVITATDSMGNSKTETVTFTRVKSDITISGSDDNIGTTWAEPEYAYTVADSSGNAITVTEYVDDEEVRTITNAQDAGEITFSFGDCFEELENEESHTAKIKAVNTDGAEAYRILTFTKSPDRLEFETKPIETDAAANRIIVNLDYDKTGEPEVVVEACNDMMADVQHWEDMTEEFTAKKAHVFTNEPEDGFAVSVRVTIKKNKNTSRVYCNGLGICFD